MPHHIVKSAYPPATCPPGLEATQGPNACPPMYIPFSNAATHEYAENEGWTYVTYKKKGRKSRQWRDVHDD